MTIRDAVAATQTRALVTIAAGTYGSATALDGLVRGASFYGPGFKVTVGLTDADDQYTGESLRVPVGSVSFR